MTALCIVGGVLLIGLILGGLVWQELRQVRRMNASGDVYAALERGEAVRYIRAGDGYLERITGINSARLPQNGASSEGKRGGGVG